VCGLFFLWAECEFVCLKLPAPRAQHRGPLFRGVVAAIASERWVFHDDVCAASEPEVSSYRHHATWQSDAAPNLVAAVAWSPHC
jgi:hypothetical protein